VFINSFFIDGNEGHLIIVTNKHFEHLYDLEPEYAHRIMDVSKKMALALKEAYGCDGVTIRQNNEPASGQHAFHYHMHVFPRYDGDSFDVNILHSRRTDVGERSGYVGKIKRVLS
jgi:histidine triad (HIT) family protein